MVPVLDQNNNPLHPCSERRARILMQRGEAQAYWQKQIFCIKLLKKETVKRQDYRLVLGIDPGSKREGYTVTTENKVVLNITTNTPNWVKKHIETRKDLRRARRYRNTPYRKMRPNRGIRKRLGRLPPSTKSRWDVKLKMIKFLTSILPITDLAVEEINAISKSKNPKWNKSFSPLQHGKNYFNTQINQQFPYLNFILFRGKHTYQHRKNRGFIKNSQKLKYIWSAHNIDSHSLCEMLLEKEIVPFKGLYRLEFIEFHRRMLHRQVANSSRKKPNPTHYRSPYGSTISLGLSRGSIAIYKNNLVYIGSNLDNNLSVHSILFSISKKDNRISRNAKLSEIKILNRGKIRVEYLHSK